MFKQLHYFKSWLLLMLCTFVGASSAWAQSDYSATYTSNVTLSTAGGTTASTCKVVINETQYDGIKIGTTKAAGAMQIAIPEGTKYLHMHISGWNGVTELSLNVTGMDPAPASLSVTADAGVNSNSPFTLQEDPSTNDFYKVITFSSPLENETTLTFTTSGKKRCVIYGVNAEEESDPSDTRADAELSFSSATASATIGQDFTAPTLSTAANFNGTVEYESSNESVAQVADVETGELNIMAEGTTTITATFAGNDDYKAGSASYTLTVTDNRIATTISCDNIEINLADVANLTQLTATVKDADDNTIAYSNEGFLPEVYFESVSDEAGIIGSIDSNGEISLNSVAGTATIKAIYNYFNEINTYKPSQCTFTITVVDPNAPGTENNPYTVTDALAATPASGVYVQGTISSITEVSTQYKNATYTISDGTSEMTIYRGRYLNDADFTSEDQIAVDDVVKVYGNLTKYNNVNQMAQNNYIVKLTRKELSSITLSGTYTTTFVEGSEFNHEGVVVTATYSDQTTADVTSQAEFSTPDMTQVGEQTVTVSYGGQSTSYNITITEAPTHTATFSVNGTTSTEDFKEGAAITFPSVTAPTGYTFKGWTETAISTTQETAPADLTSSATMGNADITYYAVFAVGTGSAPSLTKMVSGDTFTDGDKVVIVADVDETTSYGLYQETISSSYVKNFVFDNDVETIAADSKNYLTVSSGSDGKWKLGDDTNGYLYNSEKNNLAVSTESATEWTLEDNEDGTFSLMGERYLSCRTDLTTENANRWRMAGSSTLAGVYELAIYKFVDGNISYSDYCTTIPTTVAITITSAGAASFSCGYALDFSKVSELTAYKATSKSNSYVHLDEVEQVPAGAGVIVKGAEGTYNVPVATGDVAELEGNKLVGTAEATYTVGDDYGKVFKYVKTKAGVVGFQKAKADWTCQIGHAYLYFPETQAREFIGIFDEDISTGINAIDNGQLTIDNDAPAYNLAGQKVGKGYKGIVVKNGKKVVIK